MKKLLFALFVSIAALGLSVGDADAARLGGGRSVGMQRQSVTPRPVSPAQQAAPTAPAAPTPAPATPAPTPKRNWMGPLAGLAAGLGIAALLSHFGMGEGMANVLMIVLLVMAAVFVFKLLFRRNEPARPADPMRYAGAGNSPEPAAGAAEPLPFGAAGSVATGGASGSRIPADFDAAGFLRIAKLNFIRLQAANDTKNLDDIREFVSPEMYAEIQLQMAERGNAPQQTDVVTLNAELLAVDTEENRHIASVQFSGMIRETVNAAAVPFSEVWNLSKPADGSKGWVVAGIQQAG